MPGTIFSAGDIVGKTLIALKNVKVWTNTPDSGGKVAGRVDGGNSCGVVYSWVTERSTGSIYWMFNDPSYGGYYFIKHEPGAFDISALRKQGVLSVDEKLIAEENKNKPWYQKLGEGIGNTIQTVAIIGVLGYLAIEFMKTRKK